MPPMMAAWLGCKLSGAKGEMGLRNGATARCTPAPRLDDVRAPRELGGEVADHRERDRECEQADAERLAEAHDPVQEAVQRPIPMERRDRVVRAVVAEDHPAV